MRSKWRHIGRKLEIGILILNSIESKHQGCGSDRFLEEVVLEFLNRQNPKPTWLAVINALKHQQVDEGALANEIERRFEQPDTKQDPQTVILPVESTPRECITDFEQM